MKGLRRLIIAGGVGLAIAACQQAGLDQASIGLNRPAPGTVPALTWAPVTGASAYQVTLSMDRGATLPVGTSGFTANPLLPLDRIIWQEGHPVQGRPYFWTVRAYDRPDPSGLLLVTRGPTEITFDVIWAPPAPAPTATATPAP